MPEIKVSTQSAAGEGSDRRRSHRVQIAMPVLIRGKRGAQPFEEDTRTIAVSAHGCMVRMETPVTKTQPISIVNVKTGVELPCTVTFVGQTEEGKTEVGMEFIQASPHFWRIAFPPVDWDPSERKRPTAVRPPLPAKSR